MEAQLAEDGTYPNASAVFGEGGAEAIGDALGVTDMPVAPLGSSGSSLSAGRHEGEEQPRDWHGRYASWGDDTDAADPSGTGEGPHAPDGTPIEPASAKSRARLLAKGIGALLGFAGRLIRRWRPEEPEEPEPPTINETPQSPSADPPTLSPPNLTLQDLARVRRGFAGPKSAQKWLNQMNDRGWTPDRIEEAISGGESFPAENRVNRGNGATRYIHPKTGRSVIIDDTTDQVIQVGGDNFGHY